MSNHSKEWLEKAMNRQVAVWIADQALQRMVAAAHGKNGRTPESVRRVVELGAMTGGVTAKLHAAARNPNKREVFAELGDAATLARLAEVVEAVGKLREPCGRNPELVVWKPEQAIPRVKLAFRVVLEMARKVSSRANRKPKASARTAQVALMS